MKKKLSRTQKLSIGGMGLALILFSIIAISLITSKAKLKNLYPEIARSMSYDQVTEGEEKITGTDYVTFDAFFLRDLNGDGVAEGIRGMCRQIGQSDTLYMELKVLTNGHLENGLITINSTNAYFQTAIPKDDEIAENAVGTNTKTIKLNTVNNGTQKLLTAIACSGNYSYPSLKTAAIGNDVSKYSKINSITLTGTHVAEDGTRTPISKEVEFNIDWYGTVKAEIPTYLEERENLNQEQNIETAINEEAETFTVVHNIGMQEVNNMLNIKKAYIEGTIPELNGYAPTSVKVEGTNVTYTYDEETKRFTAQKEAVLNENEVITAQAYDETMFQYTNRYNKFKITITYPLKAYQTLGVDTVESKLTVKGYYEGYNNPNTEFRNPYKSNEAKATFIVTIKKREGTVADFKVYVGKQVYGPSKRYLVSKEKPIKIYNGISEKETDDTYLVRWIGHTGTDGQGKTMIMKETKNGESQVSDQFIKTDGNSQSMEDVTTNVGIYFSNPVNLLGEEGYIKVYDDETDELIETFTNSNWNQYSASNPYKYEIPRKHVRIETSVTNADASLSVYHVKQLNDEYITENYCKEEFDKIQYIKSTLTGYLNEIVITDIHEANYETPYALAMVGISKTAISTQETEKNMKISITVEANEDANQVKWKNGAFLLKLPQDILNIEINNIGIRNNNVKITSYEQYEEAGINYIKINTENETLATYDIVIDCNITSDPRIVTKTEDLELYSYNENAVSYWETAKDSYDINDNLNTEEMIGKTSISISLVSPNSLLTSQTITNYNSEGSITIAPKIAEVSKEQRTANINIEINNNYTSTISEVQILGRVPYEGNKYTITNAEMGSTFTATMQNTGIQLPEALKEVATVYYSENGEATKELTDTNNGWTTTPKDYSKVKSYLIDLGSHSLVKGEKHTFTYTVDIPEGLNYNQTSYSHHGIYFSLDTETGKYRTQTEPNKIGLMVAKQYELELTKYQKEKEKKIAGATYLIIEEGQEEGKTKVTQNDETNKGKLTLNNLYIGRTYIIKEIKSPIDYELNANEIKFKTTEENGELKVTLLTEENTVKSIKAVQPQENQNYKVQVEVEDEVKARLKVIKTEEGSENLLKGARFKIIGKNFENGLITTTNNNGEINLRGLSLEEEYTVEEVKSPEGYYQNTNKVKFTITNNNGEYKVNITEGTVKTKQIVEENIPTLALNIENEKIPTYNLQIIKVVKGEETRLQGAKFNLYKGNEKVADYTTNENGTLTIENLYQYETEKGIDQTYTLKEVLAPEGYAAVKDITFQVENKEGLLSMNLTSGTIKEQTVEGNTVTITIEDSPSFKLIKKDGETGQVLPNTKFAIYNVDNGTDQLALDAKYNILGTKETINGKEYYTLTTNEKGEIEANLREGLYKAVEVKASDDKYDITDNIYYFGIGTSREAMEKTVAEWAASVGGSGEEEITSVVGTSDGGYIVAGYFNSRSIQVGDYTLTLNGSDEGTYDAMLIKYSKEGAVEWATSIRNHDAPPAAATEEYTRISSVAETSDGGYIVGGDSDHTSIQAGDYTLNTSGGGMLIKYSNEGAVEWATSVGGWNDKINSVAGTSDGGYIVGGCFRDSIQVGDYTLTSNGNNDGMLIKYNKEGEVEWATLVGKRWNDEISLVAETGDGGYIVGGYFGGEIQVGNDSLTTEDECAAMLIKYSKEGTVEWATSVDGSMEEEITSIAGTCDGGYIVGGEFYESIQVGAYTLTSSGTRDGMLIKYSKEGEVVWATSVGKKLNSVSETSDEGYIVGGYFESSIQVGDYTLTSNGDYDGMLIKYSKEGEVEWATSVGGSKSDEINSVAETRDGDYIVGGYFESRSMQVGDDTLRNESIFSDGSDGMLIKFVRKELPNPITTKANVIGGSDLDEITSVSETKDGAYIVGGYFGNRIQVGEYTLTSNGNTDGMLIKYSKEGVVEWTTSVGGDSDDFIETVAETSDGGYIVGGYFYSSSIQVGDYILTSNGSRDGMLIKYNKEGDVEWATSVEGSDREEIATVEETRDGGYIVGGYFESNRIQVGDYALTSNGNTDGMLIKYSKEGAVEWATSVGESGTDRITSVAENSDGGYIVGGYFNSSSIQVGDYTLTSNGDFNGMLIKYSKEGTVEWVTSVGGSDYDYIKSVAETNDGGYIVGGYFESSIQVGDYTLTSNGDFDGMVIKYSKEGTVEWTKAVGGYKSDEINSVVETSDGTIIVGGYFNSSTIETDGKTLSNNGSQDGMLLSIVNYTGVPEVQELTVENERKEFKITTDVNEIDSIKGGSISGEDAKPYETVKYGESNTKEIIMTPEKGYEIIAITVNGEGYKFTLNEDGTYTMPTFENIQENKHIVVTYALATNKITINKIDSNTKEPLPEVEFKLEQIEERTNPKNVIGTLTANGATDYFVEENGTYQSNNQGKSNTTANSYIPIDLTSYTGKYNLTINAKVSSESDYDYGYATVTTSQTAPAYNSSTGRFVYLSGTSTNKADYNTILQGGQMYYLHLGYYKDEATDTGEDSFTVSNIRVTLNDSELYHVVKLKTNSDGQAITQIPYGKYSLTELSTLEGYEKLKEPLLIEFRKEGNKVVENNNIANVYVNEKGEFIVENRIAPKVIVHHYLKDENGNYTTTKLAEDDVLIGSLKTSEEQNKEEYTYLAKPHLDLEEYELEKDENGNYVIPENATGEYTVEEIEVTYYYETKEIPMLVNHYIQGTNIPVPLANGETAKTESNSGKKGENYTTNSIEETELNEKYELVEVPSNYAGIYENDIITVNYYYKIKEFNITTKVEGEGGTITGENEVLYETVEYGEDSQKEIKAIPEEDYIVSSITVNGEEIEFTPNEDGSVELEKFIEMIEDKEVVVTFEKIPANVIVHYYIEGTETKVPSKTGGVVEDINKAGKVNDMYATKPSEEVANNYELVATPENASGEMTKETIVVTYYYRLMDAEITSSVTKEGTDKITEETAPVTYQLSYTATVDKYIGNAEVILVDTLPFEIDQDKSNLQGGNYNQEANTITWKEPIENIDTFTGGVKTVTLEKEITVVYKAIDTSKTSFENKVEGTIKLETTNQEEKTDPATKETETEFTKDVTVTKTWNHTNNIYEIPIRVILQVKNGETVVAEQEVTEEENWAHTFTGLQKYDAAGTEINYQVGEKEATEGELRYYEAEINNTTKTITNNYIGPVITSKKEMTTQYGLSYVVEGEEITYTINVENAGGIAKEVVVKDTVPEGTTFVEGSIKINGTENTSNAEDLKNGITVNVPAKEETNGKVSVSFKVTVDELPEGILEKQLDNTAIVDNENTNTTTINVKKPKVEFNKTSNPSTGTLVKVGDEITYTIEVSNTGTAPTEVIVKDSIPVGTTYVENSLTIDRNNEEHTVEELNSGITLNLATSEKVTITFKVTVNDLENETQIRNVATVNDEETNEIVHTYVEPIISQEKTMTTANGLSYVVEGEEITYTINVENAGGLAKEVVVKDTVPEGTTFVEGSIKVNGTENTSSAENLKNGITVNVPTKVGETNGRATVSFKVKVNPLPEGTLEKEISNTAMVDETNTNTTTVEVNKPQVGIKKVSNPESGSMIKAGDKITYTVEAENTGTAPTKVTIKDSIPTGTNYIEDSLSVNRSMLRANEVYTVENLNNGITLDLLAQEKVSITFEVTVNDLEDGAQIRNVASVNDKETNETVHNYVESIISQSKSAKTENGLDYVVEGEKITYTVQLNNAGGLAKEVVVKDNIPEGTSFVEGSIRVNGTESTLSAEELKNGITVNVPVAEDGLPGYASVSFDVTVNEGTTGDIKNTATVDDKTTNEVKTPVVTYEKVATTSNEANEVTVGDTISYKVRVTNTGTVAVKNITVKDTIPEGTKLVEIADNGQRQEKEITWVIDEIVGEETKEVGFTVEVEYAKEELTITNVATVDNKTTNETENPYKKTEPELTSKVEKTGTDKVTSKDTTVYYEVKFTATVNDFVGKAKVTMVDTLPYAIDESKSKLDGGTYDSETNTITWEDEIENIHTFNAQEAKEIAITKVIEVSYLYGNLDNNTGSMLNRVDSKIELQEPKVEDPTAYETVKEDDKDAEKETVIEIPAQVIVHHYFYDVETKLPTTVKLVNDGNLTGIVGQEYTTRPSSEVTANYTCMDTTPERYEGKMTEDTIEVIYYYLLTTPSVTNTMEKTATANKVVDEVITNEETGEETTVEYPLLTKENEEVVYNINYNAVVDNYIGKVAVEVVDTLPAKIDTEKSDLNGGNYNEATRTITWTIDLENINTYANGVYKVDFAKQVKLVYVDQNVNSDLMNTVTGTTKIYYPEEHPTKGGKEQVEETATDEETVKQDYRVNLEVVKVWEDNDNLKGKRPESVEITIKEMLLGEVKTQVLSEENNWSYTIQNLPKYDKNTGRKLTYVVEENEVNRGDLEYYENPEITLLETQTAETSNYKYTVKNSYKLLDTDLNAQITKNGTEEITVSEQTVDYTIHFTAEIANYIGNGKVTIVDTLPYEIDLAKSKLNGGHYNVEDKTITWEEELPHINTEVSKESYQVDITKQITVVYKDLGEKVENTRIDKLTNIAKGKVELYETDEKDEKETTFDTNINITGKVVVRYVDKDTGKDIIVKVTNEEGQLVDRNYNYEITDKVGNDYRTELKDIENYIYVESTNNETGIIKEQDQEVIYYYEKRPTQVIVKYQDKEGNPLTEDEIIDGRIDDSYTTTPKDIENYQLVIIPDNKEGTMEKDTITVIYVYEKIPAKVIVKYLEKDTEKVLAPEDTIDGGVADAYETQRKAITGYKKAEPEPTNASGIMKLDKETNNTITVIYYYERIPSGIVTVKYVDADTKEEITYEDPKTQEEKTYRYEIKGYVGDKYDTEEKEIPYYNLVKVPSNKQGTLEESGDTVIYYYSKQKFNMEISKEITKVVMNGEEKKVTDGKLAKIEIVASKIPTTELEITYSIKVRNTEELAGKGKVVEIIPRGYTVASNTPGYWNVNAEGNLETTVELNPGEEKTLEVVLRWNNSSDNFGEAQNTAKVTNTENEANYEETTLEDNTSTASIITSIKTGMNQNIWMMITRSITLLILIGGFYYNKKNKKQK